mmetsp:Transcript_3978/g.14785  ORF Transcript_3978/g.14785 Transcript_3978/m.14785 type:complete len:264 (+) Transcript_3978:1845-2636(+)
MHELMRCRPVPGSDTDTGLPATPRPASATTSRSAQAAPSASSAPSVNHQAAVRKANSGSAPMAAISSSVPQSQTLASPHVENSDVKAAASSGMAPHAARRFSGISVIAPDACTVDPSLSHDVWNTLKPFVAWRACARNAEMRSGHVMSAATSAALMCGSSASQSPQSPCVAVNRSHSDSCVPAAQSAPNADSGTPGHVEHVASNTDSHVSVSKLSGPQAVQVEHVLPPHCVHGDDSNSPGAHGRQSRAASTPYDASKKRRMRT